MKKSVRSKTAASKSSVAEISADEIHNRMVAGAVIARKVKPDGIFNGLAQAVVAEAGPKLKQRLNEHIASIRREQAWRDSEEAKDHEAWNKATEEWDTIRRVCSDHHFEEMGFDNAGKLMLCIATYSDVDVREVTPLESIVWMADAERMLMLFEDGDCHPAATARWLRFVASAMEKGGAQ